MKPGWNYFINLIAPEVHFFFCFSGCKVRESSATLLKIILNILRWSNRCMPLLQLAVVTIVIFFLIFLLQNFSNTAWANLTRKGSGQNCQLQEWEGKKLKLLYNFIFKLAFGSLTKDIIACLWTRGDSSAEQQHFFIGT